MKGFLLVIAVVAAALLAPVDLSCRQTEILCCRPVCECDPEDVTCDLMSIEKCRNLGGWEVEDCTECESRQGHAGSRN